MKSLQTHARAIMTIILIVNILFACTIFRETADPIMLGKQIYNLAKKSTDFVRPQSLEDFLIKMDNMNTTDDNDDIELNISKLNLSIVLDMRSDIESMNDLFLLDEPLDLEEAKERYEKFLQIYELYHDSDEETDKEEYRSRLSRLYQIYRSPTHQNLINKLIQLESMVNEAKADRDDTFRELNKKLSHKIILPIINQEVNITFAIMLIIVALLGPFIYLISLCYAIKSTLETSQQESPAIDWIFFHPGWIGPVLGVIWLLLPFFTFMFACIFSQIKLAIGIMFSILFFIIALIVIYFAFDARDLNKKLTKKNESSPK